MSYGWSKFQIIHNKTLKVNEKVFGVALFLISISIVIYCMNMLVALIMSQTLQNATDIMLNKDLVFMVQMHMLHSVYSASLLKAFFS